MNKQLIIKTSLFVFGLLMIFVFIGGKYDCVNDCILKEAGKLLAIFVLIAYLLLFFEKARKDILEILKIYIPAMFILFTALFYIDSTQYEQHLKRQKEYRDLKFNYAALDIRNIEKSDLDVIMTNSLKSQSKTFEAYVNTTLNGYKVMIGKAMIGLTVGLLIIILLELLKIYRLREDV